MHLLHKVRTIIPSRSSTQTEVEIEDVVQVMDVVVAVATKIKINSNSSHMMHRGQIIVEEDSLEAGGEAVSYTHLRAH